MAKKPISKSIRLSEEVYDYISGYRGEGFNEKFENIILDYQRVEKDIQDRIRTRQHELGVINEQVKFVIDAYRELDNMIWRVDDCMALLDDIEKNLKAVADDVSQK